VATREQFAGSATAESIVREAGCPEAFAADDMQSGGGLRRSHKRISTDEIARCLNKKPHPRSSIITHRHFTGNEAESASK